MTETDLGLLWLARVPFVLPHVRVFRNAIVRGTMQAGWYASGGIEGHGDAFWIAPPSFYRAYYGQVEWKSKAGRMRESQKRWQKHCLDTGVPYLVLRAGKGEEPSATVERWVDELRTALS
jgi:hypothetical protein